MTASEFALWCRAIRECDDPGALARLRERLDAEQGNSEDARPLRFKLTTKRVRLLEAG